MSEVPIFTGQMIYPRFNPYAQLLFPLVQIKKVYKTFYDFLLKFMWNELIYNKKNTNELVSLVLFLGFWVIALLTYYFKSHISIIIFLSFLIWCIDFYTARKQYLKGKDNTAVTLTLDSEDIITWSTRISSRKQLKSTFNAGQVASIALSRKRVFGGAFQEVLGKIWQIELQFWDGSDLVIHEQSNLVEAFKKACQLAEYFGVKTIFSDSQGYGDYSERILEATRSRNPQSYWIQQKKGKFHLMTRWRWQNTRLLLGRVFQESGFSLFVILMSQLMANLGAMLNTMISAFNRQGEEVIVELPDIFKGVTHDYNWLIFINLFLALGSMLYQGWRLSRAKHLTIDKHEVKYTIDNHSIERLKIATIEAILLIQSPTLAIVILGQEKAIILDEFQRLEDCQAFLTGIVESIESFPPPAVLE